MSVIAIKYIHPDHDSSAWSRLLKQVVERYPDISRYISYHKFPGAGQRPTPICCSMGFIKLVNLLDGSRAADFRHKSMEVLHRYLTGDLSLVDEICERAVSGRCFGSSKRSAVFEAELKTAEIQKRNAETRGKIAALRGMQ